MDGELARARHPRMIIYSQDGFGLGHMRRTNSVASQMQRIRPDAAILTLSDSRLGQFFETAPNHDFLKLPSIVKDGPGRWRPVNLPVAFEDVLSMRQELIRSAVLCFDPHILLVDHMPHGAMGELLPTLQALKTTGSGTRIVLGLRDILDAPEVVMRRWQAEGAYDALERFYDMVLIYGMEEVYDLSKQYAFLPRLSSLMHYCGYVCTPATARYAARARQQSLFGTQAGTRLIVAMAGGGADAYPMMSALLDAVPAIQAQIPCVLILVTGPFMPAVQRRNLEARARGLPVRVRISVSDILSYIDAADLIVAMAGYNSTIEILRSGKRAILIPRAGPSAEQRTRARLFADRGWVEDIDPDELSSDRAAQVIISALQREMEPNPKDKPNLEGIKVAVNHLLSLLPNELARNETSPPLTAAALEQSPALI